MKVGLGHKSGTVKRLGIGKGEGLELKGQGKKKEMGFSPALPTPLQHSNNSFHNYKLATIKATSFNALQH